MLTASRALVGVAARSLASPRRRDVTLPQYRALVVLAARGPAAGSGDLAEALGVHPSTATRLCDRLVDRRLVRAGRATASNRRETTISLVRRRADAWSTRVTDVRRGARSAAIVERIPADCAAPAVAALAAFAEAAGEPPPEAWTLGWS